MSAKAMFWAHRQPVGSMAAKALLLAYAAFADEDSYETWAANETLMDFAEIANRGTLRKARELLIEKGYLAETAARAGGTARITVFQMLCPPRAVVATNQKGEVLSYPPPTREELGLPDCSNGAQGDYDDEDEFGFIEVANASYGTTFDPVSNLDCGSENGTTIEQKRDHFCTETGPVLNTNGAKSDPQEKEDKSKDSEIDIRGSAAGSDRPPILEPAPFKSMREQAIERLERVGVDLDVAAQLLAARRSDRFTEIDAKTLAGEARKAGIETTLAAQWAIRNGTFTAAAYRENPALQEGGAQELRASPNAAELEVIESVAGGWIPAARAATTHGGLAHV